MLFWFPHPMEYQYYLVLTQGVHHPNVKMSRPTQYPPPPKKKKEKKKRKKKQKKKTEKKL